MRKLIINCCVAGARLPDKAISVASALMTNRAIIAMQRVVFYNIMHPLAVMNSTIGDMAFRASFHLVWNLFPRFPWPCGVGASFHKTAAQTQSYPSCFKSDLAIYKSTLGQAERVTTPLLTSKMEALIPCLLSKAWRLSNLDSKGRLRLPLPSGLERKVFTLSFWFLLNLWIADPPRASLPCALVVRVHPLNRCLQP